MTPRRIFRPHCCVQSSINFMFSVAKALDLEPQDWTQTPQKEFHVFRFTFLQISPPTCSIYVALLPNRVGRNWISSQRGYSSCWTWFATPVRSRWVCVAVSRKRNSGGGALRRQRDLCPVTVFMFSLVLFRPSQPRLVTHVAWLQSLLGCILTVRIQAGGSPVSSPTQPFLGARISSCFIFGSDLVVISRLSLSLAQNRNRWSQKQHK